MKKRLVAIILYTLFWLLFFIVARSVFLILQYDELTKYNLATILNTFIKGFKMDLSAVCYFITLPILFAIPGLFFPGKWYKIFLKIYSYFLIIIFSALVIGDAIVYSYWGFRLEFFIMDYLKTPGDAAASANSIQIIGFTAGLLIMSGAFIYFCNKLINKYFSSFEKARYPLLAIIIILIISGSLIIPIRGGFGVATLNPGTVYFSSSLFPNHAALNLIWNFGYSAAHSKPAISTYSFHELSEAMEDHKILIDDHGPKQSMIRSDRPNVLLIILESFGSYLTDQESTDSIITPRFREFVKEGIYFTNIYAAGSRTDKAIPAIFSGYPHLPTIRVISEPKKTQSMPGLFKMLDSAGYKTSFWYGGDINFANINSFISTTGFRQKITKDDFDSKDYNSKWGVHDDVLLSRLFDSLSVSKQPFAYSALTLSSHEPFEVPMETVFKGQDDMSRFKNSVYYADKSLGEFIDRAKNTDWWGNTLVILIADHCRRKPGIDEVYAEEIYKIPMLWIGGALEKRNIRINKLGNQVDMPLTIACQLNLKSTFRFSKDLLSDGSNSFVFYTYNEGFVFITDTSKVVYDIKLKENVVESDNNAASAEKLGKSFLQVLYDDYLKR